MFQVGDYVVNATGGICQIMDVVLLDLSESGQEKEYYLLEPVLHGQSNSRLYIPVDIADRRMRHVISKEQAWEIIHRIPEIDEAWIDNEKEREKRYKEVLLSCDLESIVAIIKNMYSRKQLRLSQGKKSTALDDRYFKMAENHLYSELAFAIGQDSSDMQKIIQETMEAN
ncbi:MAG: CarD family transcriptional regulator, partial [Clostridiales bacterium]|nr:CarD family transcriptional regulator [Clostridiales bacterium]